MFNNFSSNDYSPIAQMTIHPLYFNVNKGQKKFMENGDLILCYLIGK